MVWSGRVDRDSRKQQQQGPYHQGGGQTFGSERRSPGYLDKDEHDVDLFLTKCPTNPPH